MRTMIGWFSFTKSMFSIQTALSVAVFDKLLKTYYNVYATAFLICSEKTEKCFFDLCIYKSLWFVEKSWGLYLTWAFTWPEHFQGAARSRDVIMDNSWPCGSWSLRADHHVSFRPLLSLSGSWNLTVLPLIVNSYVFGWFSSRSSIFSS